MRTNCSRPMTKFVNVISWCGVFQMSTASSWNAGLDIKIVGWYHKVLDKYGKQSYEKVEDDCGA